MRDLQTLPFVAHSACSENWECVWFVSKENRSIRSVYCQLGSGKYAEVTGVSLRIPGQRMQRKDQLLESSVTPEEVYLPVSCMSNVVF